MKKLVFTYISIFLSLNAFSQTEWKLRKDDNNIKIFTRGLPNENFNEYKAKTEINSPIEAVVKELLTAPSYFENCPSGISYYVKKLNTNQHVFYAHQDLPWPVKDRDLITLLTVEKLSETKYNLKLESLPNALPVKGKTIRIKKLMGYWFLKEKNKKTQITQQLFVDPEGSLPTFIVNKLLIKGPYKTFSELREIFQNKTTSHLSK